MRAAASPTATASDCFCGDWLLCRASPEHGVPETGAEPPPLSLQSLDWATAQRYGKALGWSPEPGWNLYLWWFLILWETCICITRRCFQGANETEEPIYFLVHLNLLLHLERTSHENLGPSPVIGSSGEEEKAGSCVLWLIYHLNSLLSLLVYTFSRFFRTVPRLRSFDSIPCPPLQPTCYSSAP